MSTFSQVAPITRAPLAIVTLPPSAFNPKWKGAPRIDVRVGISLLSSADVETAKASAALEAWRVFPRDENTGAREETFKDILVRWLVARATSDPNDVTRPFSLWREAPEDIVRDALSLEGLKTLWDAIDRVARETSPVQPEIDDDGIAELFELLDVALPKMPPQDARRFRRLLGACLTEAREFAEGA